MRWHRLCELVGTGEKVRIRTDSHVWHEGPVTGITVEGDFWTVTIEVGAHISVEVDLAKIESVHWGVT